jgi:ribosomal protein RSM22 (predicted rRNA methylase)
MRIPSALASAFDASFENFIADFAVRQELLPDAPSLKSNRYVARAIVPHIHKLSSLFNREEKEQSAALDPYWKESSNPAHLRAAYFLYFMPSNLFRIASVWAELSRLGFRWNAGETIRGIEFGAGPAPGASASAVAEKYAPIGMPQSGNWALIEQDKAMLELGKNWAEAYCAAQGMPDWGMRPFHRKMKLKDGFLPRNAPKFNAWIMSFFLNEFSESPREIAQQLIRSWELHLEEEGVAILIEPALKLQSRKLLEIRRELLAEAQRKKIDWLQILLPCLGHQACGALAAEDDWCHEEAVWWRPPYFRLIDQLAELDRKTLPFSYLVVTKSKRPREEILPALAGVKTTHRLVSPSHKEGKELEFFVCSNEGGKRRARFRPAGAEDPARELERGDILTDAELRGDARASRIDRFGSLK